MINSIGVVTAATFAPANIDERDVCPELVEKIRARDLWHEASRFWRKLLAHTVCVKICVNTGNEPLQFERLIG